MAPAVRATLCRMPRCRASAAARTRAQAATLCVAAAPCFSRRPPRAHPAPPPSLSPFREGTRELYAPFESGTMKAPSSDVYVHEMPGGQYTNLKVCVGRRRRVRDMGCARKLGSLGARPRPASLPLRIPLGRC